MFRLFSSFILFTTLLCSSVFAQNFEIGTVAKNIILTTPEGTVVKLSDLRGQMVLVDFWASWCAPCRRENPFLVEAYKKYKDVEFKKGQGFTVLSVSLDTNKGLWKKAIENDQLNWPYNISDLMGWRSQPAQDYEIRKIPSSFLIDGEGVIIAINLRGENLETMLKKHRVRWFKRLWS